MAYDGRNQISDIERIEITLCEHDYDHDKVVKELAAYNIDEHELMSYYQRYLK